MGMNMIEKALSFIYEVDKLKSVYRKAMIKSDQNRYENSAEHSWHIALTAITLQQYIKMPLDIQRVVTMLLLHDIVEIDAGDTFAFADQKDLDAQHEKELQAAQRIFGLLPEEQGANFLKIWLEFEEGKTIEARYAVAIDRILPLIQNMQNEGGSWAQHHVSCSQVLARHQYLPDLSIELWQYVCEKVDEAVNRGWLKPD